MNPALLVPPPLVPSGIERQGDGLASRAPALDGARGVAALLVFGKHFCTLATPWTAEHGPVQVLFQLLDVGSLGVDLFFLLSGYLIYGSLIRQVRPFGQYLARRLQRIYPTFIVVFTVYVVLMCLLPNHSKIPPPFWPTGAGYLMANLALLPGVFAIPPLMTVAWSLSYELAAYLGWPVMIGALRLRSWSRGGRIVMLALAAVFVLQYAPSSPEQPLIKFGVLLMGGLVWELTQSPTTPRLPGWGLIGLLAVVPLTRWLLMTYQVHIVQRWILLCLVVLLYDLAKTPESVTGRLLSNPLLRRLGLISYSFYLIHGLMLHAVFLGWQRMQAGGRESLSLPGYLLLMMCAGAVSVAAAQVLFWTVERPYSFPRNSSPPGLT
jgi:exopolysaccharide production protein ExoZ